MPAKVVAYTTPTCPHCKRLKEYLNTHGVPFENRDVSSDPTAVEELQQMNALGVPVTRIGSEVIIGFDPDRLEAALRANQLAPAHG